MPRGFPKNGTNRGWFKKGQVSWIKSQKGRGTIKPNSGSFKKGQNIGNTFGFKKGFTPWNKGKEMGTPWNKGKKMSDESRLKMSKSRIGKEPWNKNKHGIYSKEHLKKMSLSRIGKYSKEKHPNWQGGKSFEKYSVDWTQTLKRSIRERDRHVCRICGSSQENRLHDVHHIDYNKKNCDPNNLITLCKSCHMKTNKNRDKWLKYFKN